MFEYSNINYQDEGYGTMMSIYELGFKMVIILHLLKFKAMRFIQVNILSNNICNFKIEQLKGSSSCLLQLWVSAVMLCLLDVDCVYFFSF